MKNQSKNQMQIRWKTSSKTDEEWLKKSNKNQSKKIDQTADEKENKTPSKTTNFGFVRFWIFFLNENWQH